MPDDIKYIVLQQKPFDDILAISTGFRYGHDRRIGYDVDRISDEFLIKFCISGSGWFKTEGVEYKIGKGDIIISRKDVVHKYGADEADPWSIYWAYFCGSSALSYYNWIFSLHNRHVFNIGNDNKIEECFCEMYSILEKGYAQRNMIHASNLLKYLLSLLISGGNSGSNRNVREWELEAIVKYMMNNINNVLVLDDLVEKYGTSKDHFIRSFYKKYGYTPMDYFNRMKIQKSCELLVTSNMSISHVAENLGFADAYYFSRLFRQKMNTSPREYRKKYSSGTLRQN